MLKGKNKEVIGFIRDELGGKIMSKSVVLRVETFSCLIDEGSKDQKAKRTKKCFIKRKLKFENYENCLNNNST